MMSLCANCASVTIGKDRFCKKWPDEPPIHYDDGDNANETKEKDDLILYWLTRCE